MQRHGPLCTKRGRVARAGATHHLTSKLAFSLQTFQLLLSRLRGVAERVGTGSPRANKMDELLVDLLGFALAEIELDLRHLA